MLVARFSFDGNGKHGNHHKIDYRVAKRFGFSKQKWT